MNKKTINLILGLVNTVLLLAVAEVGLRIYDRNHDIFPPDKPGWIKFSPTLQFEIQPGYEGIIYNSRCSINSLGIRDREITDDKGDTIRIICMGNSTTFGNTLDRNETYPVQLEKFLRQKSVRNLQVINAGIPGYSTLQGLILLEEKIWELQPDLIVISYGFNDRRAIPDESWQDSREFFKKDALKQERLEFFRKSFLFRWIIHLTGYDEHIPEIEGYLPRVTPENYKSNLEQIIRAIEDIGVPVIMLGIPDRPDLLSFYHKAEDLLEKGHFFEARDIIDKTKTIYGRIARYRFNRKLIALNLADVVPLTEQTDLMAFHGGKPVFTAEEYNGFMRETADRLGIEYIDLSNSLEPSDYVDYIHLNKYGCETVGNILTAKIIAIIDDE